MRAVGFRGEAFGKLLGADRYVWMRGLGNKALDEGRIELLDTGAVDELLELIVKSDRAHRRVIFFCACETPARKVCADATAISSERSS